MTLAGYSVPAPSRLPPDCPEPTICPADREDAATLEAVAAKLSEAKALADAINDRTAKDETLGMLLNTLSDVRFMAAEKLEGA